MHEPYKFVLNTGSRIIDIYNGGWKENKVLENLPMGIKWENIELILNNEDKKLREDLAEKLFNLYKSGK